MSLEKAIEANTAAVEKNNELLAQVIANQQTALGKVGAAPADTTTEGSTERGGRRNRGAATDAAPPAEGKTESRRDRRNREAAEADKGNSKDAADAGGEGRRARRGRGGDDAGAKDAKPKKLTIDDVRAAGANFLDVSSLPKAKQEQEEDDRRGFLEAMLDELGIDKLTEAKADDFEQIIDWLKRFADGEDVRFPGEGQ